MDIQEFLVDEETPLKAAMEVMDRNARNIVYVTKDNALVGSLSDGDVRRWILKDKSILSAVQQVMFKNPVFLYDIESEKIDKIFSNNKGINSIPIINQDRSIRTIFFKTSEQINNRDLNIPVVIMAGGKGTRLYPYTKILPKPLIPIGDTPIVERIINKFNSYGCKNFIMSVNYKKNMIKSYFTELGASYDVSYIEEDIPLGTGGSLSLMKDHLMSTFFVSNCDILIRADYTSIIDFHNKNNNDVTMIASLKNTQIPYGVLKLDKDGLLESTMEKPEYTHLINTGMYVLEPSLIDLIPENEYTDLPTVILKAKEKGMKIGVYPISENAWLDMGQVKEMENMIESLGV